MPFAQWVASPLGKLVAIATASILGIFTTVLLVESDIIQFRLDAPGNEILCSNDEYAAMMAAKSNSIDVILSPPIYPPIPSSESTGIVLKPIPKTKFQTGSTSKSSQTTSPWTNSQAHRAPPLASASYIYPATATASLTEDSDDRPYRAPSSPRFGRFLFNAFRSLPSYTFSVIKSILSGHHAKTKVPRLAWLFDIIVFWYCHEQLKQWTRKLATRYLAPKVRTTWQHFHSLPMLSFALLMPAIASSANAIPEKSLRILIADLLQQERTQEAEINSLVEKHALMEAQRSKENAMHEDMIEKLINERAALASRRTVEMARSDKEIHQWEDAVEEQGELIAILEGREKDQKREIASLQEAGDGLKNQISKHESDLKSKESLLAKANMDNVRLMTDAQELSSTCNSLQAAKRQLSLELTTTQEDGKRKDQVIGDLTTKNSELLIQLKSMEAEQLHLAAENQQLHTDLETSTAYNAKLRSDLEKSTSTEDRLRSEVEKSAATIDELYFELRASDLSAEDLRHSLEKSRDWVADVMEKSNATLSEAEKQIANLQSGLDGARNDLQIARAERDEAVEKLAKMPADSLEGGNEIGPSTAGTEDAHGEGHRSGSNSGNDDDDDDPRDPQHPLQDVGASDDNLNGPSTHKEPTSGEVEEADNAPDDESMKSGVEGMPPQQGSGRKKRRRKKRCNRKKANAAEDALGGDDVAGPTDNAEPEERPARPLMPHLRIPAHRLANPA